MLPHFQAMFAVIEPLRRATVRGACAATFAVLALALPVNAQETREAAIQAQVDDKAAALAPYVPGKIERAMLYVEEKNLLRRLSAAPDGWYPRLGGLTTGSGFAIGPGYRRYFQRDGLFDISGSASLKSYRAAAAYLRSPSFADGRLAAETRVRYRHYPQERFFGVGLSSLEANRTAYLFEDVGATGGLILWPNSPLRGGISAGYTSTKIGAGAGRFPSIEARFSEATAPGLEAAPDYLHVEGYVEVDYRDLPGNPRSGGRHRVGLSTYRDRDLDRYSFQRLDAEVMQLFPFLDKRRVIALRAAVALTDADAGNEVPFYMLPFVGGPETLRGYRERRFADQNLVLLNAEYRYEIFAALDMALFVDAASVAPRVRDLALREFKTDYGLGFRFGTRADLIMRFDIGLGGEGTRYFLKFGPAF